MTTVSTITADSIMSEFRRLQSQSLNEDDGGMTSSEIATKHGVCMHRVQQMLRQMCAAGALTCRRAKRQNVLGEWTSIPVYFAVEKPKPAKVKKK